MAVEERPRVVKLLQGNEACAEGAIYAGCRFFAGYPISPSSEIAEVISVLLPRVGGKFIQMEDEIASMAAIIGASLAGLKSMTATSGPGYSLKVENIGYAVMAEVPCVIVNVMRGGPSTGLPTSPAQSDVMQARWGTHGDHPAIALAPASVQETFYETVRAFNLAERFRMPVSILIDEVIAHMRERIEIPHEGEIEIFNRVKPTVPPEQYLPYEDTPSGVPPLANFGEGYRFHVTGLYHDQRGYPKDKPHIVSALMHRLMRKIELGLDHILSFEDENLDDAEIAVLAYGSSARSAKSAVRKAREQGLKVGLFRPITLWPFPDKAVEKLASRVKAIVVPEMNMGQMVLEVERASHGKCEVLSLSRVDGEPITPLEVLEKIKEVA